MAALIDAATGRTISRVERAARASRAAHALRRLGLADGDAVALACDNRPEFIDIWATQRAGLMLVPVSTRLKVREIAYVVTDSGARASDRGSDDGYRVRSRRPTGHDAGARRDHRHRCDRRLGQMSAFTAAEPRHRSPTRGSADAWLILWARRAIPRELSIRASGSSVQSSPPARVFGRMYGIDADTAHLLPAPLCHASPMAFVVAA